MWPGTARFRIQEPCDELDPDDFAVDYGGAIRDFRGRIRLCRTREWFFSDQDRDLKELIDVFEEWRNQDEYLHFAVFEGEKKVREVAVLCSKRGNRVYVHRVRERLKPLLNLELPPGNRSWNRTRILFITLTYDTKLKSAREAWASISEEFNRWITDLRNKYGKLSYVKCFESTERGYPHIHLLVVFREAQFPYFALNGKFRVPTPERDRIRSGWHSFVDVEAVVSPRQAVAYTVKYLIKAHGGKVKGKTPWEISEEGVSKTLALLWVYRKRGFSLSRDLEEALADLIAKPCATQTFQVDLFGEPLTRWVLLGVRTPGELGIQEDPPPFFVVLWEKGRPGE